MNLSWSCETHSIKEEVELSEVSMHSGLDELGGAIHNIYTNFLTGFLRKPIVPDNGTQSNYFFMNKVSL